MAGGVLKGFGGVTMVLGALLLLAGLAGAGYAYLDEQENQDNGVFYDGDRSDANTSIMMAAAAAFGVGIVLLVVASILLAAGGARGRRAFERALREGREPAAPAPATAAAGTEDWVASPPASPPRRARSVALVAVALLGLAGVVAAVALLGGGDGGLLADGPFGADSDLGNQTLRGSTDSSLRLLGQAQSAGDGDSEHETAAPAGARRMQVTATWDATTTGPSQLTVQVEVREGDAWTPLREETGPSGLSFEVEDARLASAQLRLRVLSGDPASGSQDYALDLHYWRA